VEQAQQESLTATSRFDQAPELGGRNDLFGRGQVEQLGGLDSGTVGHLEVVTEARWPVECVAFGQVELYRQGCPLQLVK